MKGTLVRLALFALASLVCLGWLASNIGQVTGPAGAFHKTYSLTANFSDATGLVGGDEVRLAGVRIGKVTGVKVDKGQAVVGLKVDKAYKLPASSRFELHWKNLLGQRYVQVVPPPDATPTGPAFAGGAKIATDRTQAAADLSELLNQTQPLLARLDTDRLNRVMATMAAAMQGREGELNQAIGDSAQLVDTLSARADVIGKSISEFATLLDGIASHDTEVKQLLDSLSQTSQVLANKAQDLGDAAGKTGEFSSSLARVLAANQGDFDTVFGQTKTILDRIVANKDVLDKTLRTLPWTTSGMIRMTANWRNSISRSSTTPPKGGPSTLSPTRASTSSARGAGDRCGRSSI